MNTPLRPDPSIDAEQVEPGRFEIEQRFTTDELSRVSDLWKRRVEVSFETIAWGEGVLTLSTRPPSSDGALYMTVRAGKQLMQLVFSGSDWLEEIQKAFQEGQLISDHPLVAAIAIEAQLTPIFVGLERALRSGLEIVDVSFVRREPFSDGAAGLAFDLDLKEGSNCGLSVYPETVELRDDIIDALRGVSRRRRASSNRVSAVNLTANLVGDAIQMTREKLRSIKPGDGFMLDADWTERARLRLMVQGHLVAEMSGSSGGFEVKKVLVLGAAREEKTLDATRGERKEKRLRVRKSD